MRRRLHMVAVMALVAALAACGSGTQSAEPSGAPSAQSTLVGREFPVVALRAWSGSASVDSIDVVANRVVNLWASWCASCRAEFALMAASERAPYIVAVNVDDASKSDAAVAAGEPLVDKVAGAFPVYVDSADAVLRELGISGLPVTVAVDGVGRIVDVQVGQLDAASLQRLADAATAR